MTVIQKLDKLERFVKSIAEQRRGCDLEPEEYEDADFEGAWESIIEDARRLRNELYS